jgi:protein-tyrosine-phosphatase
LCLLGGKIIRGSKLGIGALLVKVLFVCTGNACRSPLADALLKKLRPDVDTDSAGTYAYYKVVDLTRRYAEKEGASEFLKHIGTST